MANIMTLRVLYCGLAVWLGVASFVVSAAEVSVYVIAHPAANVSADVLRDIYTGDKQFSGAQKVVPLDNASLQANFLARVLNISQGKYDNLWIKKSFRDALNPPAVKSSDREIIAFVKNTPGAIGYISHPPPPGVTLVKKF
jgi:ABC-type phosphate transport system substrate-binding protein